MANKKPDYYKDLVDLKNIHNMLLSEFEPKWKRGEINGRLIRGQHWTETEKKEFKKDARVAYSIPLVATKFNRIIAEQIGNRRDWKGLGREHGDDLTGEIATGLFKYVDDHNNFKDTESDVYKDGAKICGAVDVRVDTSVNPKGEIKITRVPYNELLWDVNSREYNVAKDAQFMQRFGWWTRRAATQAFGYDVKGVPIDYAVPANFVPNIKNYFLKDKNKDIIKIIWHQEKITRKKYLAKEIKEGGSYREFDTKQEAEDYIGQQVAEYAMKFIDYQKQQAEMAMNPMAALAMQQQGQQPMEVPAPVKPEDFRVVPQETEMIKETVFSGTHVLEVNEYNTKSFSWIPYFQMFDDGEFWSIIDLAHDPQRWFDRTASMIDKGMVKGIKGNNYWVNKMMLDPTELENVTSLKTRLSKGGEMFLTNGNGAMAIGALQTNINLQNDFSLLQMIQSWVEDIMGGRTWQGLESKTEQTATEVSILEKSASLTGLVYLNNLRRWKQLVGEKVLELIPECYNQDRQIRILGKTFTNKVKQMLTDNNLYEESATNQSVGWLKLSEGRPIDDAKIDVIVGESQTSEILKQLQFNQIKELVQAYVTAGMQPPPPDVWLEYSNYDPTVQEIFRTYYKEQQAQQAAMAEEAKKQQEFENHLEVVKVTGDNINAQKKLEADLIRDKNKDKKTGSSSKS